MVITAIRYGINDIGPLLRWMTCDEVFLYQSTGKLRLGDLDWNMRLVATAIILFDMIDYLEDGFAEETIGLIGKDNKKALNRLSKFLAAMTQQDNVATNIEMYLSNIRSTIDWGPEDDPYGDGGGPVPSIVTKEILQSLPSDARILTLRVDSDGEVSVLGALNTDASKALVRLAWDFRLFARPYMSGFDEIASLLHASERAEKFCRYIKTRWDTDFIIAEAN